MLLLIELQACLLNDEEGITLLTTYGKSIQQSTDIHTDQLSLALEPECVALYCHQLPSNQIADYAIGDYADHGVKNCLVLDIGGGTVDITALKQVGTDSYEVTVTPTGNEFGGRQVNEHFREFLQNIVGDEGFEKFLKNKKTHEERNAVLQKLIYHDFEEIKVQFGSIADYKNILPVVNTEGRSEIMQMVPLKANNQIRGRCYSYSLPRNMRLKLPEDFMKCYSRKIDQVLKNKLDVQLHVQEKLLSFNYPKMASFFEPVLEEMSDPVINAVCQANESGHLSIIYMAGGFGGCKYVYQYLKDKIRALNPDVPLLVPADHTLAVCKGAVLYGRNPGAITTRKMEASYGIRVSKLFQEGVHEERHAYHDPDGTKRCGNIFRPFVIQGDKVKANNIFTIVVVPQFHTDTEAKVGFYSSTNPNVRYTTDVDTRQIGEIKLSIPNPTDRPIAERRIEIMMNLSSTEIKVTARASHLNDKPPVSAVLDFITTVKQPIHI